MSQDSPGGVTTHPGSGCVGVCRPAHLQHAVCPGLHVLRSSPTRCSQTYPHQGSTHIYAIIYYLRISLYKTLATCHCDLLRLYGYYVTKLWNGVLGFHRSRAWKWYVICTNFFILFLQKFTQFLKGNLLGNKVIFTDTVICCYNRYGFVGACIWLVLDSISRKVSWTLKDKITKCAFLTWTAICAVCRIRLWNLTPGSLWLVIIVHHEYGLVQDNLMFLWLYWRSY